MLRSIILTTAAIAALIGCQPTPDPEQSAREVRISQTQAKMAACAVDRCETLNLDSGLLEDFSTVSDLTHVTALRMSWTDFDDLSDITAMTQLRELHISSTQISDLGGLTAFENLEVLHLQWSKDLRDFTPVGQMTGLTELALGGNDIGDMAFVAGLTELDGLSLVHGTVTSLEALRGHPSLSRLDLEHTKLPEDLSALLSIPNLAKVSVQPSLLSPAQSAFMDQLRARGVQVEDIPDVVVVIC